MKHLIHFRVYESQTSSGLTPEQQDFLNLYTQGTWSVNPTTGLVDIQGLFLLFNKKGTKYKKAESFFGVKFGNVTGDFYCFENRLESLTGAPQKVDGNFNCSFNQLQSLVGAPQKVDGNFNCSFNQLQSLVGAPQEIHGNFSCAGNQLQSLEGAPQKVGGNFGCSDNQLQSLEGAPREVGGDFSCANNELKSLEGAPKEINGEFRCDAFKLRPGKWNIEGLMEVLVKGEKDANKLIITLPCFDENFWNSKISENPESTILLLSAFWDDMTDEFKNSIRMSTDLRDDFDNLLELVRSGIM